MLNTPASAQNQAWSEILPTQKTIVPQNLYATPGYYFIADVQSVGGNTFHFYMYNYYNGAALSYYVTAYGLDASTADYIIERPTVNGSPTNLSNFGSVPFQGFTDNTAFGDFPNNATTMYGTSGRTLAYPSGINSGYWFTDTQSNCN